MRHGEEDHRITPPRQTDPVNASATHNKTVHASDDACPTAMPGAAGHTIPTSDATAKKTQGVGSQCLHPRR